MTKEEIQRWPMLIQRKQVRAALGVNDRGIGILLKSGQLRRVCVSDCEDRHKYLREDVEKILRFDRPGPVA
jgi:hypothetical protein